VTIPTNNGVNVYKKAKMKYTCVVVCIQKANVKSSIRRLHSL